MKVVFLSVSSEMGGSEASLFELVRGIRRLEPAWEPSVIVPRDGPLARRVRESGAGVHVLPLPAALARLGESRVGGTSGLARRGAALLAAAGAITSYTRQLSALLHRIGPDLVHSNGFKLHVLGTRAVPSGTPVVWHLHEYVSPRRVTRVLLKQHVAGAAAIAANSRSVAADLTDVFGTAAAITTIYNAVDLDEFSPAGSIADLDRLSGMAPAAPGTIRVGLLATFGRWKGHETFVRAIQRLRTDMPVRAYIIGGPLYDTAGSQYSLEELRQLALDLGVADRVGFTGFIDRPAAILRALDVVVHASTQPEPFGLVIAQGMACGRAVIVSAAGGAAELVRDEMDAVTHPPGDIDRLTAAIERCAADPAFRERLGVEARRVAESRFDPDTFTRAFVEVYRRVAATEAAPA